MGLKEDLINAKVEGLKASPSFNKDVEIDKWLLNN